MKKPKAQGRSTGNPAEGRTNLNVAETRPPMAFRRLARGAAALAVVALLRVARHECPSPKVFTGWGIGFCQELI